MALLGAGRTAVRPAQIPSDLLATLQTRHRHQARREQQRTGRYGYRLGEAQFQELRFTVWFITSHMSFWHIQFPALWNSVSDFPAVFQARNAGGHRYALFLHPWIVVYSWFVDFSSFPAMLTEGLFLRGYRYDFRMLKDQIDEFYRSGTASGAGLAVV